MKEYIRPFLNQKNISENSKIAYSYDLEQFIEEVHGRITETNLRIYQASIKDFKVAVQKRKLSAVNQFLYFLYQQQLIEEFHRLVLPKVSISKEQENELLDLSAFWQESSVPRGRLMALLILEMGLLPSEILQVRVADVNLDFQVLKIEKGQASLSAHSLREQFILRQREKGIGLYDIAQDLGLKTMITLEKYR